ncbi:hypothetical protein KBD81_01660 [Candidatus Woesebacteria bacterium]|nr:hypothetical protein [Candidatus Woesebacteria bacterium]
MFEIHRKSYNTINQATAEDLKDHAEYVGLRQAELVARMFQKGTFDDTTGLSRMRGTGRNNMPFQLELIPGSNPEDRGKWERLRIVYWQDDQTIVFADSFVNQDPRRSLESIAVLNIGENTETVYSRSTSRIHPQAPTPLHPLQSYCAILTSAVADLNHFMSRGINAEPPESSVQL